MDKWDFYRMGLGCGLTWTKIGCPYLRCAQAVPVLSCCPDGISETVPFYSQNILI